MHWFGYVRWISLGAHFSVTVQSVIILMTRNLHSPVRVRARLLTYILHLDGAGTVLVNIRYSSSRPPSASLRDFEVEARPYPHSLRLYPPTLHLARGRLNEVLISQQPDRTVSQRGPFPLYRSLGCAIIRARGARCTRAAPTIRVDVHPLPAFW